MSKGFERFDRQMRIEGWNQEKIYRTDLTVLGDTSAEHYFSLFAAALGFKNILELSPVEEPKSFEPKGGLHRWARQLGTHVYKISADPICTKLYRFHSEYTVNFNSNATADLIGASRARLSIITSQPDYSRFMISVAGDDRFYTKVLEKPIYVEENSKDYTDPVQGIILASTALDILKNKLMYNRIPESTEFSTHLEKKDFQINGKKRVLMVGAGALGNAVALALADVARNLELIIIDPDTVEYTNLNRQVIFSGHVGEAKSKVLAGYLGDAGLKASAEVSVFDPVQMKALEEKYGNIDIIMGCVDNNDARYYMSKIAEEKEIAYIDGGTSPYAGQARLQLPGDTPLYDVFKIESPLTPKLTVEDGPSCTRQPDPSVIMTNAIIGGAMVNLLRYTIHPERYDSPLMGVYYSSETNQFSEVFRK